ncbi:AraC family transcriptional regulator [Endozoicomonas sp. OPT23]|uniref:AraC family transcriptional regulator n=1 Tax=Endozoicomonas sp. OPT23 TaxID=2072845 RepID=UPI00129AF94F|nr:AraC family transcriptional regulator [Endozoicomonas sp. OPT23]MRI33126.1 AraC family transcriptional regulator [Endozoicomonas sp. OPT23]
MDQLSSVLSRFSISAGVFYSGQLCGLSSFEEPNARIGHIHLLKKGTLKILERGKPDKVFSEPTLLFYPRPTQHRIMAEDADNTEIVCAEVHYGSGPTNPLASSMPDMVSIPLARAGRLQSTIDWLFEEAFSKHSARQIIMDRLCEIMIIQLLRHLMSSGDINGGLLAGLSDPKLAQALDVIHNQPEHNWSLVELSEKAMMSRSRFAEHFKKVIGITPNDYLSGWRVEIAKGLLKQDKPVGWVANEVGYENASALARVFRSRTGMSPKEWLGNQQNID